METPKTRLAQQLIQSLEEIGHEPVKKEALKKPWQKRKQLLLTLCLCILIVTLINILLVYLSFQSVAIVLLAYLIANDLKRTWADGQHR